MTQTLREIILQPMVELYPPPQHLRNDDEAKVNALQAYELALACFDRDTLARAWKKVVAEQTYWVWPNPGVIAEACRQCQPKPKLPSEEEQRRAQALQMADEYTSRYMRTSQVAKLAKREGWAGHLRHYVADAAWVQAQLICTVQNMGWNFHLADKLGDFHSSQEAFNAYRKTIDNAVQRRQIRVTVPRGRIADWQEQCRQQPEARTP